MSLIQLINNRKMKKVEIFFYFENDWDNVSGTINLWYSGGEVILYTNDKPNITLSSEGGTLDFICEVYKENIKGVIDIVYEEMEED